MRSRDERLLMSRHLATDQPSTFRGGGNGNGATTSSGSDTFGGGLLDTGGLHPGRTPMGNLAPALRRSMPAVNAQQQQQQKGQQQEQQPASRHLSFCLEPGDQMMGKQSGQELGESATVASQQKSSAGSAGTWRVTGERGGSEHGRCTSAHSFTSLSPSGSLVFHPTTASSSSTQQQHQHHHHPNPIELGHAAMVLANQNASVVDTRQIQVFLKKREDSQSTIATTLSEMTTAPAGDEPRNTTSTNTSAHPATLVHSSSVVSSSSGTNVPLKNSRKVFRSTDTRSSIFSVSSSLDSAKEEQIISNFKHTPAEKSHRVVVLPRPHPLIPSQSLQVDYGRLGADAGGDPAEGGDPERCFRSSSAEHPRHTSVSPLPPTGAQRRTSMDSSTAAGPITPNLLQNSHDSEGSPLLSSWHSISDLNSARHSDNSGERRRPSGANQIQGGFAGNSAQGRQADGIWYSPPPPRPQSQASNRRSNYLGELVWQVDETVYCGGIEAAQNQNLLCRLNIEYIVDLSGQQDDPSLANSRPRTEYPCLCPKRTAHSRMTMSIRIKDDSHQQLQRPSTVDTKSQMLEREEIIHYFEALIDLIRKARISQKKVLIHSLKGRNRAPAFVAAYLMHCNRVTRVQAINKISKMMNSMRPGTCISDTLQRALMRWQSILGIRAESSRLDSQQLNKMFAVKRTAWN